VFLILIKRHFKDTRCFCISLLNALLCDYWLAWSMIGKSHSKNFSVFDVQNATAFIGFFPYDNRDALFSDSQSIDVYAFFKMIFRCFDIAWSIVSSCSCCSVIYFNIVLLTFCYILDWFEIFFCVISAIIVIVLKPTYSIYKPCDIKKASFSYDASFFFTCTYYLASLWYLY